MKNFKILIILILFILPVQARYQYVCNEWTGQCEQMNIRITDNQDGTYRLRGTNYDTNSPIYGNNMKLKNNNKLEGYIYSSDIDRPGPNMYRFKIKEID